MPEIVFIRHSISQQEPGRSAHEWVLTPKGRAACAALAARLQPVQLACIYSSDEPKAQQTAAETASILGIPWATAADLHETRRDTVPFYPRHEDFIAVIQAAMQQPEALCFGEERFADAQQRFMLAVEALCRAHPHENFALVTHGTVLALALAAWTGQDAFALWRALKMPAYARLKRPDYAMLEWCPDLSDSPGGPS